MQLTVEGCRSRQKRLLEKVDSLGISISVVADSKHVLYLTGYETPVNQSSAVILDSDGRCTLIQPVEAPTGAVDEVSVVEPSFLSTLHLDHGRRVAEKVREMLGKPDSLVGLDKGGGCAYFGEIADDLVDLSSSLFEMRRAKDPDELALIRKGIEVTEACYARAKEIIQPGISELDVYSEIYTTAVRVAGSKLQAMGNDFQCASAGGPPRSRAAEAGELYILDLGVELSGYNSDSSRTFPVDGVCDEAQKAAWRKILEVFEIVEGQVRPGFSCRKIFHEIKSFLDGAYPGLFFHHLGHGIGLSAHERPNLNPHWNHIFNEGDVFTVEPGLYHESLRAGIRIEENYLITADGVEKLTRFPVNWL